MTTATTPTYGLAMQKMLQAFPQAKEKSNGWWSHSDNPAFDFREEEDGRIVMHSWTGRSNEDILAVGGMRPPDIYPQRGYRKAKVRASLDLLELAQAKCIHWKFLFELGLEDGYKYHGYSYVKIPYYLADGTQHTKIKVRKAISGKYKHCWDEGTPGGIIAYGLNKLDMAREQGWLLIGEGESDAWACWYHGVPYLGLPGASSQKCLTGVDLAGFERVYILQEPDQARKMLSDGQGFYKNVHRALRANGYTGEIFCIQFEQATGCKDPSDLHIRLWQQDHTAKDFSTIIHKALETAAPANDTDGQGPVAPDYEVICQRLRDAIEKEDTEAICSMAEEISLLKDEQVLAIKAMVGKHSKKLALTARDFDKLIAAARVAKVLAQQAEIEEMPFYKATPDGMGFRTRDGDYKLISNFSGKIAADLLLDDGAERIRHFEVQTICQGKEKIFTVAASDYDKAEWVNNELGSCAQITVAKMMKWHLTEAIKFVSHARQETRYTHTGWRKVDDQMVYLHAGGGLGRVGRVGSKFNQLHDPALNEPVEPSQEDAGACGACGSCNEREIVTYLKNSLTHYSLSSVNSSSLNDRVRASLAMLDITSDTISVPLYTSLWRAVLGMIDYGVHLAGQTGKGKSELCALIQQHFGATMTARHLPGSWLSTENALEMLMFQCKDAVLVIDDFKPIGSKNDQDRLHSKADGVFRRVGNNTSRGRLTAKLEGRPERPPRCMILSTGEDTPRGESLKGRGFFLLMEEGITSVGSEAQQRLTACQQDANSGGYAECMAAYIQWLAPRIEQIQAGLHEEIAKERERLRVVGHSRSGSNTASALVGMRYFLQFARESEALSEDEATALFTRCEKALLLLAEDAAADRQEDRPAEQWKLLVAGALASKKAHLLNKDGSEPENKLAYGWIESSRTSGPSIEYSYQGGGDHIGWIEGDNIYLLPHLAYKVICALGQATRNEVTTSEKNLRKYLAQEKVLASTDQHKARPMITTRVRLQGVRREVLHLKVSTLFPDDDNLNSPSNDPSASNTTHTPQHDPHAHESASEASAGVGRVFDSEKSAHDPHAPTQQYEPKKDGLDKQKQQMTISMFLTSLAVIAKMRPDRAIYGFNDEHLTAREVSDRIKGYWESDDEENRQWACNFAMNGIPFLRELIQQFQAGAA